MSKVIIKPDSRIETPDGPLCATVVDGCVVHGDAPLSPEGRDAMREVIKAARLLLPQPTQDQADYLADIAAKSVPDMTVVVGGPSKLRHHIL